MDTFLMLNTEGFPVWETPQGRRWLQQGATRLEEENVSALQVCRGRTRTDVQRALHALTIPAISASIQHDAYCAWQVWRTPVGQRTPLHSQKSYPPEAHAFVAEVKKGLGRVAAKAWHRKQGWHATLPAWTLAGTLPGPVAVRGIAWGLARHWPTTSPPPWDIGLLDVWEGVGQLPASVAEPSGDVTARPNHKGASWEWPCAPSSAKGFKAVAVAPQALGVPVCWWTEKAQAHYGAPPLTLWMTHVKRGEACVVVLDGLGGQKWQSHLPALRAAGVKVCVEEITTADGLVWVWWINMAAMTITLRRWNLAAWQGPSPGARPPVVYAEQASRVPVPLSHKAEHVQGVMPRGQANSLMLHWQHAPLDVPSDVWVARLLGWEASSLKERLSPEQIDAVVLAARAMMAGHGFILGDDTGFGKGRVVMALARAGLLQGRTVVVVTETPALFSDLMRDAWALDAEAPLPTLFHAEAPLFRPNGERCLSRLGQAGMTRLLKETTWPSGVPRLIFTTYAQLNRSQSLRVKLAWLQARLGANGWVLLDEAHNAAGESTTRTSLAHLTESAAGVLYASATYAKQGSQVLAYHRALPFTLRQQAWFGQALAQDEGPLRAVVTQWLTRAGRFVRREHPPAPLPEPRWIDPNTVAPHAEEQLGHLWSGLFDAVRLVEQGLGQPPGKAWLRIGGYLARTLREWGVLLKASAVVEETLLALERGEKPVIVVDSTLAAVLNDVVTARHATQALQQSTTVSKKTSVPSLSVEEDTLSYHQEEVEDVAPQKGLGPSPVWADRWRVVLPLLLPPQEWSKLPASSRTRLEEIWSSLHRLLDTLPAWSLSPIDTVIQRLTEKGYRVGELSGRTTRLLVNEEAWSLEPRPDLDRQAVVRAFNKGDLDVVIVTRAGSTGISLHAGVLFADQRPRRLIEWDVPLNPVVRLQFWGRVRRRDQVCEPSLCSLVVDTPAHRRLWEREFRKMTLLQAHQGAERQEAPEEEEGWLSPAGERAVEEWATHNPEAAQRLGVLHPVPAKPLGRVDRALLRHIVLPVRDQDILSRYLSQSLALEQEPRHERLLPATSMLRRQWWWGNPAAHGQDAWRVDLVERLWPALPSLDPAHIAEALQRATARAGTAEAGEALLAAWPRAQPLPDRARDLLRYLRRGAALVVHDPEHGCTRRGILLDVIQPAAGAPWGWTQIGLTVWLVGDAQPRSWSFATARHVWRVSWGKERAQASWFATPAAPWRTLSWEGHVIAAAVLGQRWRQGHSVWLHDRVDGGFPAWRLPSSWTWDTCLRLPRDLLSVEHVMDYWRAFPDARVWATLPAGNELWMCPTGGLVEIGCSQDTYQHAQETWWHPGLTKKLGRLRYTTTPSGKPGVSFRVAFTHIRAFLYGLEQSGIGWRLEPTDATLAWYRHTSARHVPT